MKVSSQRLIYNLASAIEEPLLCEVISGGSCRLMSTPNAQRKVIMIKLIPSRRSQCLTWYDMNSATVLDNGNLGGGSRLHKFPG
jgi:hypothetical protein